jgi:hypothetical protein
MGTHCPGWSEPCPGAARAASSSEPMSPGPGHPLCEGLRAVT